MTVRQHNWSGDVGGETAHCMTCRIPRAAETDATSCEGTCICICSHHIDAHSAHNFACATPNCDCIGFVRGGAVWDDTQGFILQSDEPSDTDTFVAEPEQQKTQTPPAEPITVEEPVVMHANAAATPKKDRHSAWDSQRAALAKSENDIRALRDRLSKYHTLVNNVFARRGFLEHERAAALELLSTTTRDRP